MCFHAGSMGEEKKDEGQFLFLGASPDYLHRCRTLQDDAKWEAGLEEINGG
ncbi:hypothetical protein ACNKHV_17705 [Shigella flexneri]